MAKKKKRFQKTPKAKPVFDSETDKLFQLSGFSIPPDKGMELVRVGELVKFLIQRLHAMQGKQKKS